MNKDQDDIPAFCRISASKRKAAWEANPPQAFVLMHKDAPQVDERTKARLLEIEAANATQGRRRKDG